MLQSLSRFLPLGTEANDSDENYKVLPPQIVVEILLRIDCRKTVGYSCTLVCRQWHAILSDKSFWINYLRNEYYSVLPASLHCLISSEIKTICMKQPFERNLLKNPSGEEGFEMWTMVEQGGRGFRTERPPINCGPCNEELITTTFITSFGWCRKFQLIDLWENGIPPQLLDTYRPPISISEYYNCRRDCASIYALEVQLLTNNSKSLKEEVKATFDMRDLCVLRGLLVNRVEESTDQKIVRFRRMDRQTEAPWKCIEHTFTNYPIGIRYVFFEHAGKDEQFWEGFYGSKMTNGKVIVHFAGGLKKFVK